MEEAILARLSRLSSTVTDDGSNVNRFEQERKQTLGHRPATEDDNTFRLRRIRSIRTSQGLQGDKWPRASLFRNTFLGGETSLGDGHPTIDGDVSAGDRGRQRRSTATRSPPPPRSLRQATDGLVSRKTLRHSQGHRSSPTLRESGARRSRTDGVRRDAIGRQVHRNTANEPDHGVLGSAVGRQVIEPGVSRRGGNRDDARMGVIAVRYQHGRGGFRSDDGYREHSPT